MSTEHQQYSPHNQADAIALYAHSHNFEIVRSYEDHGRSGLNLSGRMGLQRLLIDVENRTNDFQVLLVYDVSRWGRFQDADESAHYEYMLKRSGVQVHYCAEAFLNDGSVGSVLLKFLKRTMAGEFSRELSSKVFAGQTRLVGLGFRQGGTPGYGYKRQLIDMHGNRKVCLLEQERKSIQTDRIILVPGPAVELEVVSSIYRNFINLRRGESAIAADLNAQGLKNAVGNPWSHWNVREILINPKYTGANVYNRTSGKLKQKRVRNPPEFWVSREDAFQPAISTEQFQAAQAIIYNRKRYWTDDEMLDRLRTLLKAHGKLSTEIIDKAGSKPRSRMYAKRFGCLTRAYSLVGWRAGRGAKFHEANQRSGPVIESILDEIRSSGATIDPGRRKGLVIVNGDLAVSLRIAPCYQRPMGHEWEIRIDRRGYSDVSLVARLGTENESILDYYLFPSSELAGKRLCLKQSNRVAIDVYRFESLHFFLALCKQSSVGR
jgi:DNA invertase Pin-like site-specific DNA recombinase